MDPRILRAREDLQEWIEARAYRGVDPYDILRSPFPFQKLGKWPPILATQFQKRAPIDLRPLLGIRPTHDPKAIALLLEAACVNGRKKEAEKLFSLLMELRSVDPEGRDEWGYPFPWHNPYRSLPSFSPTIVVTGTAARAIYAYYEMTGSQEARESLDRIDRFILERLYRSEDDHGICFSYSTARRDICYNASLLGAEHFARMFHLSGKEAHRQLARSAADFVLARQKEDGRWNYSEDPVTGKERVQIDHHQGFVIDSLRRIRHYTAPNDERLFEAVNKGLAFYRQEQFFDSGRSMWRIPKKWPVDIHTQAQGIVTFTLNRDLDPNYGPFAERIAEWTIAHMQGKDGSFFYRITPLFKNRIRYMRWGQAWMLLALSSLLTKEEER
jgi:hypothetical protein